MRPYELLVIAKPGMDADAGSAFRTRVESWLAENGAQMEEIVDAGEMPIAFELKRQTRGRYFLFWYTAPNTCGEAVAKRLRVDEDVLRHLVVVRHPLSINFIKPAPEREERPERGRGDRRARADVSEPAAEPPKEEPETPEETAGEETEG